MMPSLDLHTVRGPLSRMLLLALLVAPRAFAGDRNEPDTFIDQGPEDFTTSTTADFVLGSTAVRAEFWCLLDEGPEYQLCPQTLRYEGLAPGPHFFSVYSYDLDTGLVDPSPASWEWVVVEEPPPLDAGTPDGGVPDGGGDAGAPGEDGGSPDGGTSGGEDAGSPDGGTSGGEDAGSGSDAGQDAGSAGDDAGSPGGDDAGAPPGGQDAGAPGGDDAGSPDGGPGDGGRPGGGPPGDVPPGDGVPPEALDYLGGGVGCTGAPAPSAVAGLLLLGLALCRRRRR